MSAQKLILAIDQGTTGTTSLLVDVGQDGAPVLHGRGYARVPPLLPKSGWVEHDPEVIWQSVEQAATQALTSGATTLNCSVKTLTSQLLAISLSNQRETSLIWDERGKAVANAIVWQDRRTADVCEAIASSGREDELRQKTGLVADPYFSASKWIWRLDEEKGRRGRAERGELRLGTIDSFLLWRLTGGAVHRTDTTNAARTAVFDIHKRTWCEKLCALWGDVPQAALPEVCPSDSQFGHTKHVGWLPDGIPLVGALGDQHAALVGQGCCAPGLSKCTLGTGGFALVHTGDVAKDAGRALVATIAYDFGGECRYALEGSMFVAGAMVEFLRDNLGVIGSVAEAGALAATVPDAGGVVIVPALTGLGAPHWRPHARGLVSGLGRDTTRAHIARAALEGIALQSAELLGVMAEAAGHDVTHVRMDGGAAADNLLMQLHADVLGLPVRRPPTVEATAVGAALVGAVGLGIKTERDLLGAFSATESFDPQTTAQWRQEKLAGWQRWARLA